MDAYLFTNVVNPGRKENIDGNCKLPTCQEKEVKQVPPYTFFFILYRNNTFLSSIDNTCDKLQ